VVLLIKQTHHAGSVELGRVVLGRAVLGQGKSRRNPKLTESLDITAQAWPRVLFLLPMYWIFLCQPLPSLSAIIYYQYEF